jgi:hypothetical protein
MSDTGSLFEDFRDLIVEFQAGGVRFLVIGAHALAAAGIVRATKDIDLFIDAAPVNAARVHAALGTFGAPLSAHGVTVEDFSSPGTVYQLGLPPRRIDITTRIDGLSFEEAWAGRVQLEVDGLDVPFLGWRELVRNKRAAGRLQDLADLERLADAGFDVEGVD